MNIRLKLPQRLKNIFQGSTRERELEALIQRIVDLGVDEGQIIIGDLPEDEGSNGEGEDPGEGSGQYSSQKQQQSESEEEDDQQSNSGSSKNPDPLQQLKSMGNGNLGNAPSSYAQQAAAASSAQAQALAQAAMYSNALRSPQMQGLGSALGGMAASSTTTSTTIGRERECNCAICQAEKSGKVKPNKKVMAARERYMSKHHR